MRAIGLWACLAVGFSPTLVDLARHLAAEPWARAIVVFPWLFARVALRAPSGPASRTAGLAWIVVGVACQLVATGSGEVRFGRIGLVPAAIGACRWLGVGSARHHVLLLGLVPMPALLVTAASPALETALAQVAALAVGAGAGSPALAPTDSGLAWLPLLAGVAWARSLARGDGLKASALRSVAAAALALPLQVVAIAAANALGGVAGAGFARDALWNGPWIVVAAFGVVSVERALRGRDAAAVRAAPER